MKVQALAGDLDRKIDFVVKLEEEVGMNKLKVLEREEEILATENKILQLTADLSNKMDRVMTLEEEVKAKERRVLDREEEILMVENSILEKVDLILTRQK